jgi:hypothetical protein
MVVSPSKSHQLRELSSLDGDIERKISHYLDPARPMGDVILLEYTQFGGKGPRESMEDALRREKKHLFNVLLKKTPVLGLINAVFPPLLNVKYALTKIQGEVGATHFATLKNIQEWSSLSDFRGGLLSMFPLLNMTSTNYGMKHLVDAAPSPALVADHKGSALEVHRRVLALEGVAARMVKYIAKVVQTSPSMASLSRQVQKNARCAIEGGGGLFGSGSEFWTAWHLDFLGAKLPDSDLASAIPDLVAWLRDNRVDAFNRRLAVPVDLSWGVPTLAFLFSLLPQLQTLDVEESARRVWDAITERRGGIFRAYIEDLKPLAKYGGVLTEYVLELRKICVAVKSQARHAKVDPPSDMLIHTLSRSGCIVGPDGNDLKLGVMDSQLAKGVVPFPDYCTSIKPLPQAEIESMVDKVKRSEDELLTGMLVKCMGVRYDAGSEPYPIKLYRAATEEALARMRSDSHEQNKTSIYPPTASMLEAVLSPQEAYRLPHVRLV